MKVLAVGATGKFAGLVVPALARRGVEVRALIHDPAKADTAIAGGAAETVRADLRDPDSLRAAASGVEGVFHITPAFAPDAETLGLNMVRACVDAGVRKFVYSGVYHPSLSLVNHASTRPIEEALYESDLAFTVLQPAMFLQGLDDAYRGAVRTGRLTMPWSKSSKMTYVDYRDVAEVVAIAMTGDALDHGTFELAAGGMLDRIELAALMSTASGRDIVAVDPDAAPRPQGLPPGLIAMFEAYDRHGFHGGNNLVLRTILGRRPTSVSDYVHELAAR
ncbi:MAG: NmrA family NAD(P)-binding protein [Streptosporangiaceae bacterium]